jgi:PIN domain nuclease of toxin-antitoxin system
VRLLLDTCTFLWYTTGSPRLSTTAKELVLDSDNELFLSAASIWEIALKYGKGKLDLTEPPATFVPFYRKLGGIAVLDLREEAALYSASLPLHHTDPFDRMLICQSIVHGLAILSPDPLIAQYRVRMLW